MLSFKVDHPNTKIFASLVEAALKEENFALCREQILSFKSNLPWRIDLPTREMKLSASQKYLPNYWEISIHTMRKYGC